MLARMPATSHNLHGRFATTNWKLVRELQGPDGAAASSVCPCAPETGQQQRRARFDTGIFALLVRQVVAISPLWRYSGEQASACTAQSEKRTEKSWAFFREILNLIGFPATLPILSLPFHVAVISSPLLVRGSASPRAKPDTGQCAGSMISTFTSPFRPSAICIFRISFFPDGRMERVTTSPVFPLVG